MTNHCNHGTCAQCACHNPGWNALAKRLFTPQNIAELAEQLAPVIEPESLILTACVMYSGGTIRPMIGGNTANVEAVGFANGQVAAVGSKYDVSAKMKALGMQPENHFILKPDETLLPGFIEPHVHIVPTALTMGWHNFGAFEGQDLKTDYNLHGFIETLQNISNKQSAGWILATGVDPSLMPFQTALDGSQQLVDINVTTLDQLALEQPVFLTAASMHTAYVNTKALELIAKKQGLNDQETQDFIAKITKQGALQELAQMLPAYNAIPEFQLVEMEAGLFEHIKSIFSTANERGITLMYDAGMLPIMKQMLNLYRLFNQHNVRVGYAQLCESVTDAQEMADFSPLNEKSVGELFQGAVKLISDGSNQGLTGFQSEQYSCEPVANYGVFNFANPQVAADFDNSDKPDYQTMVDHVIAKGWPLMIHANGDQAIDFTLDIYQNALKGQSGLDKRHRIEHCSLLTSYRADRVQSLGLSPSFLIGHVGYWGWAFNEVIFKEKAQQLDLCNSMLQRDVKITFHSDLSVSPLGPLRLMEQAVTRIMERAPKTAPNKVLNRSEQITREQALRAITIDAAWQCHVDEWLGSLAPGKQADFVILAQDPLQIKDPTKIRNIKVLQTWVGGKQRYQKGLDLSQLVVEVTADNNVELI
ncbi:MAG: amidohydrolase [Gammaproteobacteria bacterium]|nr:amidohydrolase [Gammaproteobacteria bacterium]